MDIVQGENISIFDQLNSELTRIKDRLRNEDVTSVIFTELGRSAKLLQDKVDELSRKRGLITQSDVNDAYATLQEYKRRELELENKRSMRKLTYYTLGGVIIVLAFIYLVKSNKND